MLHRFVEIDSLVQAPANYELKKKSDFIFELVW